MPEVPLVPVVPDVPEVPLVAVVPEVPVELEGTDDAGVTAGAGTDAAGVTAGAGSSLPSFGLLDPEVVVEPEACALEPDGDVGPGSIPFDPPLEGVDPPLEGVDPLLEALPVLEDNELVDDPLEPAGPGATFDPEVESELAAGSLDPEDDVGDAGTALDEPDPDGGGAEPGLASEPELDADAESLKSLDPGLSSSLEPSPDEADDSSAGSPGGGGVGPPDVGGCVADDPSVDVDASAVELEEDEDGWDWDTLALVAVGDCSEIAADAELVFGAPEPEELSPGMWSTNSNEPSLWSSSPPLSSPLPLSPPEAVPDAPLPLDAAPLSKDPLPDAEEDAPTEELLLAAEALASSTRKFALEACACSIVDGSKAPNCCDDAPGDCIATKIAVASSSADPWALTIFTISALQPPATRQRHDCKQRHRKHARSVLSVVDARFVVANCAHALCLSSRSPPASSYCPSPVHSWLVSERTLLHLVTRRCCCYCCI